MPLCGPLPLGSLCAFHHAVLPPNGSLKKGQQLLLLMCWKALAKIEKFDYPAEETP